MHIGGDYKEDQEEECVNENEKTRRRALRVREIGSSKVVKV